MVTAEATRALTEPPLIGGRVAEEASIAAVLACPTTRVDR